MLTKIIYKNFRSNLKNYILFFLSNIVAIMELFVFRGLKEIVLQIVKDTETAFLFRIDFTMALGMISVITIMLMAYAMDELYLARARYEETLKNDPEFDENLDFVLFRDHGKAIARPYYYFKKLMKKCNIDCTKHVWHDLRHTYATLLDQNNMNMKVVSEILGHYSEEFTNEVYVIHKPEVIIYDTSEVMNSFIESLKLDSTERTIPVYDISFIQEYLF